MRTVLPRSFQIKGRNIDYRLVHSDAAKKMRVRVGLNGVEVIHPSHRTPQDLDAFLEEHQEWISVQLERIDKMQKVRKPKQSTGPQILYRGVPTPIRIESTDERRANKVIFEDGVITIFSGYQAKTLPMVSLENWLRKQAKTTVTSLLEELSQKIRKFPHKVYIMGQRTKWGNCSSLHNLSFNWRLIMAPENVFKYLVTHEVVHLEVPDHSKLFWLTVQSLCPDMERSRQWLSANSHKMMVEIHTCFL